MPGLAFTLLAHGAFASNIAIALVIDVFYIGRAFMNLQAARKATGIR